MTARPNEPFLVRPFSYSIIDGDTFRIRTDKQDDGKRYEAFRIRLCSIDTPELRKPTLFDNILKAGGLDPFQDGPGELAREYLKKLCKDRVILVSPLTGDNGQASQDKYRRMLAQVTISGEPGRRFRVNGAFSCEKLLYDAGLATILRGYDAPVLRPAILDRIQRSILDMKEARSPDLTSPSL